MAKRKYASKRKSFKMSLDVGTLVDKIDGINDTVLASTRKAAHAGALVLYDELILRVAGIKGHSWNLLKSMYHAFSVDKSIPAPYSINGRQAYEKAVYHVSWNWKTAPHGQLVEYGHVVRWKPYIGSDGKWYTSKEPTGETEKRGARPFLRPTWDTKKNEAMVTMQEKWISEVKKAL